MLYNVTSSHDENEIWEESRSFESAREYIADHWLDEGEEEQRDRVLAAGDLDKLNDYALGVGLFIERMS